MLGPVLGAGGDTMLKKSHNSHITAISAMKKTSRVKDEELRQSEALFKLEI